MKRAATVVISAVVIGVGAFMIWPSPSHKAGASTLTTLGPRVLQTVTLPSGYARPATLATASDGTVWFWANSASETTLFHWAPAGSQLQSFNLGSPSSLGLITGIQNSIAIDSAGKVWLGANQSLVS